MKLKNNICLYKKYILKNVKIIYYANLKERRRDKKYKEYFICHPLSRPPSVSYSIYNGFGFLLLILSC